MGVFPPGTEGKLGMGKEFGGSSVDFFSFLLLSFSSRSCCRSFNLARKGLGLLILEGIIFTAGVCSGALDGVTDADARSTTDDGLMLLDEERPPELLKAALLNLL